MSMFSTAASLSMFSSMRSARRRRYGARPAGPSAAHSGNASWAARTAWSTSASPAREISAMTSPSMGEMSVKRRSLATRSPPIKWSGETSTPATLDAVRGGGHTSSFTVSRSSTV